MKEEENIAQHFLYPSTIFMEKERYKITTILGSCVAVCLYDTHLKIGGINHFMMPLWNGSGLASPKFGNIAISKLIAKMEQLGCSRNNMVAKVFGGAKLLSGAMDVGNRNIEVALDMLKQEGIAIKAQSVGGGMGRKIIFDNHTAEVFMKYVNPATSNEKD